MEKSFWLLFLRFGVFRLNFLNRLYLLDFRPLRKSNDLRFWCFAPTNFSFGLVEHLASRTSPLAILGLKYLEIVVNFLVFHLRQALLDRDHTLIEMFLECCPERDHVLLVLKEIGCKLNIAILSLLCVVQPIFFKHFCQLFKIAFEISLKEIEKLLFILTF